MTPERLRLLVVEDNPADADFIEESLQEAGAVRFDVETVTRLSAAIARLSRRDVDLVVVDLGLPDSQGLATLHTLRAAATDVPVVVLTGLDDEELAVAAVRDGAQDFLVKGQFGGSLLARTIRYAMERMRSEQVRKALEERLRESQKLESVALLAGGVAHEFNNMMAVILGTTELALARLDPALPMHETLQSIQVAALRSAELTRQLLVFARRQAVAPKRLDLNDEVASMLGTLQETLGPAIQIAWQPAAALWQVVMDPSQLRQVLSHLCSNARGAIDGAGTLTITTANCTIDAEFSRSRADAAPGDYVRLALHDTGSGMDEETRRHVFEPFFTTREVGQGVGLGLATVYGAVRQNGGFVQVDSAPGEGTTVAMYLPRPAPGPAAPGEEGGGAPADGRAIG